MTNEASKAENKQPSLIDVLKEKLVQAANIRDLEAVEIYSKAIQRILSI